MAHVDNKQFYKSSIKKYGISAEGVHWNSEYTQYIRFQVLTSFIKDRIKESFIIDAGCGFGEYYKYLFDNELKPKLYLGIDCEDQMISLASKRFINTRFEIQNILKDTLIISDYYICSGAMNILEKKEVFLFIENCFSASKIAFIFNFLKNDGLTNIDASDIINYCLTLSNKIEIKEDYLHNDFSVCLKK